MKIINSSPISAFGGLNFVLEELTQLGIDNLLKQELPTLPSQCRYSWKDIFFGYWSILFCGGDCAEDISINLKPGIKNNPFLKVPSPDRLLDRLKELSEPSIDFKKNRSDVFNEFSINEKLNSLNLKLLKKLKTIEGNDLVLDYDNTFIYTKKADAKWTYTKNFGYCPGVGIIGNNIVYVENRNGNCAPHTLQDETIERMFQLLNLHNIKVSVFRADSASYQFSTINTISKYVDKFYVKAVVNESIIDAINSVENWSMIELDGQRFLRGSVKFVPFKNTARRMKQKECLKEYRLVITKEERKDGQLNLFTGEAYNYSPIITNDYDKTDDEIVFFYNQRGKEEKEFDILKNDFGWNKLPFSKMAQNTVFLIVGAMCRNLYDYIIKKFSNLFHLLKPHFRLKKFIFRFICMPSKWIISGRQKKLRLYGHVAFKT
jgi:Transposase DDE domain group 1